MGTGHGRLVNDGETTWEGERVAAIRDTSDGSKLYVAATGKPYPVALVSRKQGESGRVAFSRWGTPVSLSTPKDAIDISRVTGS